MESFLILVVVAVCAGAIFVLLRQHSIERDHWMKKWAAQEAEANRLREMVQTMYATNAGIQGALMNRAPVQNPIANGVQPHTRTNQRQAMTPTIGIDENIEG